MKLKDGVKLNYQGVNYSFDVPDNIALSLEKGGFNVDKLFEQQKPAKDGESKKDTGKRSKS